MNAYAHRLAIGRRFGSRVAAGDAVFLAGTEGISDMPFTVTDGERRPLGGMNRLMLMQVMKDQAWSDSRFFTLDQVQKEGWTLGPSARPIKLQFLIATGDDGLPLESPSVKQFSVFNASAIDGVPAQEVAGALPVQWLSVAAERAGFSQGQDGLRGAVCAWLSSLQEDGMAGSATGLLKVQLAASLLEVQAGLPVGACVDASLARQWTQGIDADPLSFFAALKDAEKLAAHVLGQVRAVGVEVQVEENLVRSRVLVARDKVAAADQPGADRRLSGAARVEQLFLDRAAVLAVPFAEKDKAKALGALWYGPQSLWFVPKGVDVTPFKEWNVGVQCLSPGASESVMVNDFQNAMANMGLNASAEPVADGKWHNVAVESYKGGKNKSGSYIFSLNGGRDGGAVGTILNKQSGEKFYWRFEGAALTPEQRARMRSEALAREAVAAAEAARVQDVAAVHADEIWSAGVPADGHAYVVRKGISAQGLRQVSGAVLLQYDEFKGESGSSIIRGQDDYLIVPMSNAAGQLRAVQAISSDGKVKTFMRGAQKKGAMLVLGADSFDAIGGAVGVGSGAQVAYVEGVATGASFRAAFDGPVVVCFDAGNLETVVAETSALLPSGVSCVLAVDNDQFHVERALGFLAEKLGVNPLGGGGMELAVASGLDSVRQVALGDVVADGQWQQAARGTYCVSVQRDAVDGTVRSLAVDVVPDNGDRKMCATFENRGVEAGRVAMRSLEKRDDLRSVMVMPDFKSLGGRPSDWNDLAQVEGVSAVAAVLRKSGCSVAHIAVYEAQMSRNTEDVAVGLDSGVSR